MPKGIYQHNKTFSEEHKRNLSKSKKGRHLSPKSEIKKGEHRSLKTEFKKGHKVLKETKIKISKAHKGMIKPWARGFNSSKWKGGITPENKKIRDSIEYRLWRESVFARDNWTCQKYGIKGNKLIAHHINNFANFPELRFAIDNGITLSKKAHIEFHKKYGYKNNTKEQLEEFLKK